MEKAAYTHKPEQLQRDPDGSTLFRWDIEATKTEEGETHYECYEVRIYETPTKSNITKAVMESLWPYYVMAGLLNDHNESLIQTGDPSSAYLAFLAERTSTKEKVVAFFDTTKEIE